MKTAYFLTCVSIAAMLSACVGPGTGPYGTYTAADRYRDQTNTAIAIGATAIGATVIGASLYNAGRHDGRREVYRPPAPPPPAAYRPPLPPRFR